VNVSILTLLAVLLNKVVETLIVVAIMLPLQSFAGGYHAKTHFRCFFIMLIGWLAVMWMITVFNKTVAIVALCISQVIVFSLAPVRHINVSLSASRERTMKQYSRRLSLVYFVLSWSLLFLSKQTVYFGITISVTMSFLALSMLIAYLKNRGKNAFFL